MVVVSGIPGVALTALLRTCAALTVRYGVPSRVVNRVPSAAGGNDLICSLSASATKAGSGMVRREVLVFGAHRAPPSTIWCSTRTVRRRKSTSWTRRASSSPSLKPNPACASTIARFRSGTASASARTWSTVSGTSRAPSASGSDNRRPQGDSAISRSCTAAAKIDRSFETRSRSVDGASTRDRPVTHACTSLGRTSLSGRRPSGVPSMWVRIRESTRRAVRGPWGRLAAHLRAYSATVDRSDRSMDWPRRCSDSSAGLEVLGVALLREALRSLDVALAVRPAAH